MSANFGINSIGVSGQGNDVMVTDDGQMHTVMASMVDEGNSTSDPLQAGVTFTGESIDILDYSVVGIAVYSDVVSAEDGLCIEFSTDGTNWDHCDHFTIAADTGKTFGFQPVAKYLRVRYINGPIDAQTEFRLQVLLHKTYVKPSSHRIADPISGQDDAELVKAVATGKNPAGDWINGQFTQAGNYKMSLEELENVISVNSNSQLKVTQFDSSGNEAGMLTHEGQTSQRVVPGIVDDFTVHIDVQNIAASQAFMLVDLSDTTNWPHVETGHFNMTFASVGINPNTAFRGDVYFGFLSNVDGTDGDLHIMATYHFEQAACSNVQVDLVTPFNHLEGNEDNWFGPINLNNSAFQTDVNLQGPDGATAYPSGDGDFVMWIDMTAGNVDIGMTFGYKTIA